MPRPEAFTSFTFDLARLEDLAPLVDIVRELALKGILQSACHLVNDVVALSVLAQYPAHLLDRYSRLPDDVLAGMRLRFGVSQWNFVGGIQGTHRSVQLVKRELRHRLASLGRLMFLDDRHVKLAEALIRLRTRPALKRPIDWAVRTLVGKSPEMLEAAPHVHSVLKGRPSDFFVRHAYFKSRLPKPDIANPDRDDCGLIWFAPIAPMTGRHVHQVLGLCRPLSSGTSSISTLLY
jgi:4-cresol dehydrogenase (hydroxylating)